MATNFSRQISRRIYRKVHTESKLFNPIMEKETMKTNVERAAVCGGKRLLIFKFLLSATSYWHVRIKWTAWRSLRDLRKPSLQWTGIHVCFHPHVFLFIGIRGMGTFLAINRSPLDGCRENLLPVKETSRVGEFRIMSLHRQVPLGPVRW